MLLLPFGTIISVTPAVPVERIFRITPKSVPTATASPIEPTNVDVVCVIVF